MTQPATPEAPLYQPPIVYQTPAPYQPVIYQPAPPISPMAAIPASSEIWTISTLKQYVEMIVLLNDRRYDERALSQERAVAAALLAAQTAVTAAFAAQEKATSTAFVSAEKAVAAAFLAAEKAIDKAERAQLAVNATTNEFRAQLSDQAGTFQPIAVAAADALRSTERLDDLKKELERTRDDHTKAVQQARDDSANAVTSLRSESTTALQSLRETRSENVGHSAQTAVNRAQSNWSTTTIVASMFGTLSFVAAVVATLVAVLKP